MVQHDKKYQDSMVGEHLVIIRKGGEKSGSTFYRFGVYGHLQGSDPGPSTIEKVLEVKARLFSEYPQLKTYEVIDDRAL